MTIKHKLITGVSAFMLLAAASCKKDFLDRNPLTSVSTQVFWASETDVKSALAGVYSRLQQNFLGYERVYLDGLTDNAILEPNGNQANLNTMSIGTISATLSGAIPNMYATPYRAISSCNFFLDNVDKAPVAADKLTGYKAQVRFIRALSYFDLVQTFGGVVVYKSFPKTLEESRIAKSSKEEVYAFIEEDLDYAIANLPDTKYSGNAVKASAQALKARVLLTEQKWSEALALLDALLKNNGNKFALSNNFSELFRTAGQAKAAVNAEILFSTQYLAPSSLQRTSPQAAGMNIELGWWAMMQPLADLANDYEMTDGKPASESPLYSAANPYANRDPRLDLTMRLPGEVWKNPATGVDYTGSYNTNTGFLMEKYVDLSQAPFSNTTANATDQDYIHLRWADVLLMYAEAKNEVSGPDASVYDAIDQVRQRPGINMPKVDQARYNTKEKLRDYIRHERRVEFALEGQRYNDLKRWRIAHIKLPTITTPANKKLVFTEKDYVLPFPQSELDANPQLKQN
ncbi:RagB/SusD family nutrient uptake outer membrane protein [Paraflavisolibacter sp. H34]|uniref:RagB/SusD family nutrient uptake outer membrane protein n=1 Tax=Huijunlia imazamoxiresistens TaxID=3127457 RepID=UPI003016C57B